MDHKDVEIDNKRQELERLYSPIPPMRLIYQIFIGGTIGTFLAVITVRAIAPTKVPHLIFPQTNNSN